MDELLHIAVGDAQNVTMSLWGEPLGNLTGMAGPYVPGVALGLTTASSLLSIVGAFLIFYSYIRLVHQRNTVRLLLVFLSVADLLTACGNLAGTLRYKINYDWDFTLNDSRNMDPCSSDDVCKGQSFVTTFSSMCSFFWTVAIAIYFYISVVIGTPTKTKRFCLICHVVCWGIPAIITITASALDVLGEDLSISSGAWCWISACMPKQEQIWWMIMSGKGWEILAYIVSAVLFLLLKYSLVLERRRGRLPFQVVNSKTREREQRFRLEDQHFLYIPLVLYLLRMWGTIRFIIGTIELGTGQALVYPRRLENFLVIMHCIGDSGQAFVNSLLYCVFDKQIRRGVFCCKHDDSAIVDTAPVPDETRPLLLPNTTTQSNGLCDFDHST